MSAPLYRDWESRNLWWLWVLAVPATLALVILVIVLSLPAIAFASTMPLWRKR